MDPKRVPELGCWPHAGCQGSSGRRLLVHCASSFTAPAATGALAHGREAAPRNPAASPSHTVLGVTPSQRARDRLRLTQHSEFSFLTSPFWSQAARAAAPALGHRALVVKAVPCPGSLFFTAKKKAVTRSGRALLLFFPHCFKENDKFTELRVPGQGSRAHFRTEGCFQSISGNLFNLFFQK